jgi:two-component system sensor histidine kinase VicK
LTVATNNNNAENTEILYGFQNLTNSITQLISNVKNKVSTCVDAPSLGVALQTYRKMLEGKSRDIKVRFVTEVTKDNLHYCKQLMTIAELRHIDGIKANFAVSETEYLTSSLLHGSNAVPQLIYSNVQTIVEQQQYLFETLWEKAIPAQQVIREIEEGIEREFLEIITEPGKATEIVLSLAKSIGEEALLFLPVSKAMNRMNRIGLFTHLIAASKENGASIKIICPLDSENSETVKTICSSAPDIRILNGNVSTYSMFVVDGTRLFSAEAKRPDAEDFSEAIEFPIYSNSKHTVEVFKSFFELLWKESTLIEELKIHDKMQNEFINVASHELKTPTQSILAFSELLLTHPEKAEEFIHRIQKQANRLQKLTINMVDLTRIESRSLMLNKEYFNLNECIHEIINHFRTQTFNENKIKLLFIEPKGENPVFVYADKEGINQVISNLIDNSLRFTEEGTVSLILEKNEGKEEGEEGRGNGEVIVSLRDTGAGIDQEIFSQIFSKFVTKSTEGMGLGLFVSKGIIEAHGGRIWAENNVDIGKGGTFRFTLPVLEPPSSLPNQSKA